MYLLAWGEVTFVQEPALLEKALGGIDTAARLRLLWQVLPTGIATLKWSRDNGSVATPVSAVAGPWVTLAATGRDDKLGLQVGDWVELGDDSVLARGTGARGELALAGGALRIEEGRWIAVEAGVEIYFAPGGRYRTGDYWLAAARTLDGDVEWPRDDAGTPLLAPPHGPAVHHAPLAWIAADQTVTDLRATFRPLAALPTP